MITFDLITPTKRIVDKAQVNSVTLPSVQGEMTILPHHTELMALLGTGMLSFEASGKSRKFAVSYGFIEVRRDKVTVLAETCEEGREIDRNRALLSQQKAEEALSGKEPLNEEDFAKHKNRFERAVARQQVAG